MPVSTSTAGCSAVSVVWAYLNNNELMYTNIQRYILYIIIVYVNLNTINMLSNNSHLNFTNPFECCKEIDETSFLTAAIIIHKYNFTNL